MIGYVHLKDKDDFIRWLKDYGWKRESLYPSSIRDGGWYNDHWKDYFYHHQDIFRNARNIFDDCANSRFGQSKTDEFFKLLDYLESVGQKLECWYMDDLACLIGYGNRHRYVMPSKWFQLEELTDYSELTAAELNLLSSAEGDDSMNLPIPNDGSSPKETKELIAKQEKALAELAAEEDKIKAGEAEELADLKRELDAVTKKMEKRKKELLAELESKMSEFYKKQQEMEQQLFLLDTKIYGIRCYLGEVLQFHAICEGAKAPIDEPVVLYQKIRYLDEEMGKAVSMYEFGDSECDRSTFLNILKNREDIRDLFAPAPKCISVLKMSREGKGITMSDKVANILTDYKLYHADQMAVLVKNGGRLFITWLDEERISLSDENMFFNPKKYEERPYDEKTSFEMKNLKQDVLSRYFLFSIVQGLVDQGELLQIPEKSNIMSMRNPYIIFSTAEGWLKDNRFGMFSDIIDRVIDLEYLEGDMVLTTVRITRDDIYERSYGGTSRCYEAYNNDRGIGDKNRTKDASINGLSILPINKILPDLFLEVRYENREYVMTELHDSWHADFAETGNILNEETKTVKISYDSVNSYSRLGGFHLSNPTQDMLKGIVNQYTGINEDSFYTIDEKGQTVQFIRDHIENPAGKKYYRKHIKEVRIVEAKKHYFLSAEKEDYWGDKVSRANLEFFWDEAIPLTYLCPTWVQYAITTGNIGRWCVGNKRLNYAQSLRYLNIILDYLKKARKAEAEALDMAGLDTWMEENPEWDVDVVEWRIKNRVRKLTPYQAKRFANFISKKEQDVRQ